MNDDQKVELHDKVAAILHTHQLRALAISHRSEEPFDFGVWFRDAKIKAIDEVIDLIDTHVAHTDHHELFGLMYAATEMYHRKVAAVPIDQRGWSDDDWRAITDSIQVEAVEWFIRELSKRREPPDGR